VQIWERLTWAVWWLLMPWACLGHFEVSDDLLGTIPFATFHRVAERSAFLIWWPCLLMILASGRSLRVPTQIGIFLNNLVLLVFRNFICEEWQWFRTTEHQECHLVFERDSSKETPY
jgi:hypothetical protein